MKKLLLLLSVFILSFSLQAQDNEKAKLFFKQDEQTIKTLFDDILTESGKTFSFQGSSSSQGRYMFRYLDESTREADKKRFVIFSTNKYSTGNADLEIKGTDYYVFSIVSGVFLDFAGFWIKYINPNETPESLSAKGKDKYIVKFDDGKQETLQLLKQHDGSWIIRGY